MDIGWYLVLSAFIFCIGATGVLLRRSPLVVLICLMFISFPDSLRIHELVPR